jgi:streptomycin 6-kinase
MPLALPRGLEWWRGRPGGADWLDRLPLLASECAEEWKLRLGAPFEPATISLVVPATLPDGSAAVLKVGFPEPESAGEPDALAAWEGRGAVRLLARDEARSALLVERCVPGTPLWAEADEERANGIAAEVLRRIWRAPGADHRFRLLTDVAAGWEESIPAAWDRLGRPFERSLLDLALSSLRDLRSSQPEVVILHTRTSTAETCSRPSASPGWRSTRSRSSASAPSTLHRSATGGPSRPRPAACAIDHAPARSSVRSARARP